MAATEAHSPHSIGVTGATGQVGDFLLSHLIAQGHAVLALARRPRPAHIAGHPRLYWQEGALEHGWSPAQPIDCLLSAGPLDLLASALEQQWPPALRQVVALSSTSVASKQGSPDPAERALAARLAAAEALLHEACRRHGATLVLLRPTLIYGCGRDHSLSPLLRRARRFRVLPMPWPARGLRQPVHADDLARLMMACIDRPDLDGRCLDAGGGERLAFAEMLRRAVRASVGWCLLLPLPAPLLAALLPRWRGAVARLSADLTAENAEVMRLLGWRPRTFQPLAADFENRTVAYVDADRD
jgi:nucleoside-diphosphate-sugar epimerase